ncbi:MAG TPA: UDP-2,3-diacylglucosamine diphosphatase LpxI [Acidobacteriota bacterium]|nr:UDP-2,3-diacylglucosamine diphosphatase LpxI [Acidobacteriota bacterium]
MSPTRQNPDVVGLIAGGGGLPAIVALEALRQGKTLVIAGLKGFVDSDLRQHSEAFRVIDPGNLRDCISFLKDAGAKEVVFCGQIDHREIFARRQFDDLMASIIAQADNRADSLLGRIAETVEQHGLRVAALRNYLGLNLAGEGVLGKIAPDESSQRDLEFGWPLAMELAELNIGQAIMVKSGVVIAVEAAEATDRMIARGGELAGPGAVIIKLPRKDKDPRFDIPAVGSETIASMFKAGVKLLAFAAGNTILIDPEEFLAAADKAGIAVVSKILEWERGS